MASDAMQISDIQNIWSHKIVLKYAKISSDFATIIFAFCLIGCLKADETCLTIHIYLLRKDFMKNDENLFWGYPHFGPSNYSAVKKLRQWPQV